MASLLIKAENLSLGDTILLPMGKTATVKDIKYIGPKAQFVTFFTEHGKTRVERDYEFSVEAKAM
jgi:hypothetical protein